MNQYKLKLPVVEGTVRHCSNDCTFMREGMIRELNNRLEYVDVEHYFECSLFDKRLKWDSKRKYHGNYRLSVCRKATVKVIQV